MDYNKVIEILLEVLCDFRLIVICIVVILYLNFMMFVANYRRKVRPLKKKKATPLPKPEKKEKKEKDDEESADDDATV